MLRNNSKTEKLLYLSAKSNIIVLLELCIAFLPCPVFYNLILTFAPGLRHSGPLRLSEKPEVLALCFM